MKIETEDDWNMKLCIIGAGLPSTGTKSLSVALEHLLCPRFRFLWSTEGVIGANLLKNDGKAKKWRISGVIGG